MTLDSELLGILACPKCRGGLSALNDAAGEIEGLSCARCAVVYPVREEIPVMLVEEAVPLRDWQAGSRAASASHCPSSGGPS